MTFAMRAIEVRERKNGTKAFRLKWFNSDLGDEDTATLDSITEAEMYRAKLLVYGGRRPEVVEKEEPEVSQITLAQYAPSVISLAKGSARYKADNRKAFDKHIAPTLGGLAVAEIGWEDIVAWQEKLLANGVSAKSIKTYRSSILSPIFKRAMHSGGRNEPPIRTHPSPLLLAPIPEDDDQYEAEIVTGDEVGILFRLAYLINSGVANVLFFMLATGWRWGEVRCLQVNAINFERGAVIVRRVFARDENSQEYVRKNKAKSKKSTGRAVPVPEPIIEMLRRLCEGKGFNDFVFVNPSGVPWPHSTFHKNWVRILKAAKKDGFPDKHVTPHGLRHSFLTHLRQSEIDVGSLQVLAGHSTPQMTEHYTKNLDLSTSRRVREATGALIANVIPIRKSA